MTSNVGAHYMRQLSTLGFSSSSNSDAEAKEGEFKEKVQEALRERFKPEFLNRIDEIVIFNPLSKADIQRIVDLQIEIIKKKVEGRGYKVTIDKEAVENGFNPEYGARHLKRLIQKTIVDRLADKMIKGELKNGGKIKIGFQNRAIAINS